MHATLAYEVGKQVEMLRTKRPTKRRQEFYAERYPTPDAASVEAHARAESAYKAEVDAKAETGEIVRATPPIEALGGPYRRGPSKFARGARSHNPGRPHNFAGIAMRESAYGPLMEQPRVCARLRVERTTLWRMVKRGEFPAPVDLGKRRAVWRALDVNAWCKAHASHFERVIARKLPAALYR